MQTYQAIIDDTMAEVLGAACGETKVDDAPMEPSERASVATKLVELAQAHYRLGMGPDRRSFAVARRGPNVAHPVGGARGLEPELAERYFQETGKVAAGAALTDALRTLDGLGRRSEPELVFLRVGTDGDEVVIDLGDTSGRCIVVGPTGWRVHSTSPVLFRRSDLTGVLPEPQRGGSVELLRQHLNVATEDWPLLLGWFVAALLPAMPHPILFLRGEQGTGKTSAARCLVALVDASPSPVQPAPRDLDRWALLASNAWIIALDNLTSIAADMSDALCRAVTGDGLIRRELYTNDGLVVSTFRRPIILTAIAPGAIKGDLAERCIDVELERIDPGRRTTQQELDAAFAKDRPFILGALLDLTAKVLAALPTVRLASTPRMADFARLLAAFDAVTGSRSLDRYTGQEVGRNAQAVDDDPVGAMLRDLVHERDELIGAATEILKVLNERLGQTRPPRGWPENPVQLGRRLPNLAPALRSVGVEVTQTRSEHRIWTLRLCEKVAEHPSIPSNPSKSTGELR